MKNLEECVDKLSELGEMELAFKVQLKRANRCLELCDANGSDRWLEEARKTLLQMENYNDGKRKV